MFVVARGHRLGLDYWHYQGETLELSDVEGVKARLRPLCDPWVGRVEAGDVSLQEKCFTATSDAPKAIWMHLNTWSVPFGCAALTAQSRR
jgi:hypothetical protein